MKIILLGTGGYYPNRHRHTACLMIPEVGVVLDAGTAAFKLRDHLVTEELDIYLTHAHLDHVFGLTCLLGMFEDKIPFPIRVHGEREKLHTVQQHLFNEQLFPVPPPCEMLELRPHEELRSGGKLSWFPLLRHPGGSIGYRLEWPGHSLAYVTDTIACADADYVDQIRNVDLLIHEANFNDTEREMADLTGHCCVTDAARVAAAAGAQRLLLVHHNALRDFDEPLELSGALKVFPEIQVGYDDMAIDF